MNNTPTSRASGLRSGLGSAANPHGPDQAWGLASSDYVTPAYTKGFSKKAFADKATGQQGQLDVGPPLPADRHADPCM